jgi:hypothetical protein
LFIQLDIFFSLLCVDLINARSLQSIESSSMIVCIDQPFLPPPPLSGVEDEEVSHRVDTNRLLQMIHGGGSHWNTINRWFDKTVQVFIIRHSGHFYFPVELKIKSFFSKVYLQSGWHQWHLLRAFTCRGHRLGPGH